MSPVLNESRHEKRAAQIQRELEALQALFVSTGGTRGTWKASTGWARVEQAVRDTAQILLLRDSIARQLDLHGVTWKHDHVVAIDLCANGLDGTLPTAIGDLVFLENLRVRDNPKLHGALPSQLVALQHLRTCFLDGTNARQALPYRLAQSFEITRFHRDAIGVVTTSFQIGKANWMVDVTQAELAAISTKLESRRAPQHIEPSQDESTIQRNAHNATGPERVQAAIKLQRIYRSRIERTKFRQLMRSLFEKHFDSATGHEFFVDKRTGLSMWERPAYVLPSARESMDAAESTSEWQQYDDGNGNLYYWNHRTGQSTWEPPAARARILVELQARYSTAKTDTERFGVFFDEMDKDHTGFIDRDEFARICGELGMALAPKQLDHAFRALDTSRDGQLSRDEITAWLTQHFE